ncbi:hypothetical protein AgCh_008786 [Apium graveolens]
MKLVKSELVKLNKRHGNLYSRVHSARGNLHAIQEQLANNHLDAQLLHNELEAINLLENAILAEESLLLHKSRTQWLDLSDGNNCFFFNRTKANWNTKKIMALKNKEGTIVFGQSAISSVAVDFFKHSLDQPVTPELIFSTLKKMKINKAPSPDDFTVEFFLATWDVIGPEFCQAILHFFDSSIMHLGVNSTSIALIPKKGGAKVSWENLCVPRKEGGLGLRNSVEWNVAQILMHLCKVVSRHKSLRIHHIQPRLLYWLQQFDRPAFDCSTEDSILWGNVNICSHSLLSLNGRTRNWGSPICFMPLQFLHSKEPCKSPAYHSRSGVLGEGYLKCFLWRWQLRKNLGIWQIKIGNVIIEDVALVVGIKHNLISVSQICDRGYHVNFYGEHCEIVSEYDGKIALTRVRYGNLYEARVSTNTDGSEVCLLSRASVEDS